MHPRVSFVVPCYNYGRFVAQAVDSLLDQTFRELEVIVIDDASPDDTPQILERYAGDPRVRVVRHAQNVRHIASYNEGLHMARGEFVGVLSADDYCLRPDAVGRQVAMFDADHRVGFVYTDYAFVDTAGDVGWTKRPWPSNYIRDGLDEFRHLVFDNYVPHSGTLVRRECHEQIGYYDARLPHAGDWDMWLRVATRFSVAYVAETLYAYRIHVTNMHHSKVSPRQETTEHVLTVQKAFEALPADAPAEIHRLIGAAMPRAWMRSSLVECSSGRTRRAWAAIADAVWRRPTLLVTRELYAAMAKAALLTVVGHGRYARLATRRHTAPAAS